MQIFYPADKQCLRGLEKTRNQRLELRTSDAKVEKKIIGSSAVDVTRG